MKTILKKCISVLLVLVLTVITFCFTDLGLKASAAMPTKMAFYVPEVIYLSPNSGSNSGTVSGCSFVQYVQNAVNTSSIYTAPTVKTTTDTVGNIYFMTPGAANVSISGKFVDKNDAVISGGSISLNSISSNNGAYYSTTIASGSSPSLSNTTTGCWIKWTATYTADGKTCYAIAYSYVYKPFILPTGGAVRHENDRGSAHFGSNIVWLSGVHLVNFGDNYLPKYTSSDGDKKLLPFASDVNNANNTVNYGSELYQTATALSANAGNMKSVFASTTKANSYFFAKQTNSSFDNTGSADWIRSVGNPNGTFGYWSKTDGTNTDDSCNTYSVEHGSKGVINIDTSRYTNLAQIPNLSIGLMVTDNESASKGAWCMQEYTGRTDSYSGYNETKGSLARSRNMWNDADSYIAKYKDIDSRDDYGDDEGVKYNGKWDRKIETSISTYSFRGVYFNYGGGDTILNIIRVNMNANYCNKSSLRSTVTSAMNRFAMSGCSNADATTTRNYTQSSWTTFINAYKAAARGLTVLDETVNASTLVSNLQNAINNLQIQISFDANGGSGSLPAKTVTIGGNDSVSVNVSDRIPTRTGYTFQGWNTSSAATTGQKSSISLSQNCTVYAIWNVNTYSVSYANATANNGKTPNVTMPANGSYTIETNGYNLASLSKTGYNFSGWKLTVASGGALQGYTSGSTVAKINSGSYGNVTATAVWIAKQSALTFNSNGGSGSVTASSDATFDLAMPTLNGTFSKAGYTFNGIYDAAQGGTKYYNNSYGSAREWNKENGSVTLYAQWTANTNTAYKIEYYQQNVNGSGYEKFETVTKYGTTDTNVTVSGSDIKSYTGFTKTTVAGSSVESGTIAGNGSLVLKVYYSRNKYTITFNSNGGSAVNSITDYYDASITAPANPTKTGYTFSDWSETIPSKMPATNKTLTAQWTINQYTVTFNSNGGSAVDSIIQNYNTSVNEFATPERTGFVFGGWYNASDVKVESITNLTGNVTLAARWIAIAAEQTAALDIGLDAELAEPKTITDNGVTTSYKYVGICKTEPSVKLSQNNPISQTDPTSVDGVYGTLVLTKATDSQASKVEYVRNTMDFSLKSPEVFYICTEVTTTVGSDTKLDYVYQKLTIGTADSIYFDDGFVTSLADSITGIWIKDGNISNENHEMIYDNDKGIYVSKVNNENFKYSQGQTTKATVGLSNESVINFDFTGTGFEIIGNTTQESGTFILTITKDGETKGTNYTVDTYNGFRYCYLSYGRNNGTQGIFGYELGVSSDFAPSPNNGFKALYYYTPSETERAMSTDTLRANGIIRTGASDANAGDGIVNKYYTFDSNKAGANPTLAMGWAAYDGNSVNETNSYQTPLVTIMGLEWGKYNVNIRAVYSPFYDHNARTDSTKQYDVYFDGINIFDPMGASFNKRIVLKSLLKGSDQVSTVESTGILVTDGDNNPLNSMRITDMYRYSTNSEFILNGTSSNEANAIGFKIPDNNSFSDAMLGMRSNSVDDVAVVITAVKGDRTYTSAPITVDSAVQKFYSFTAALNCTAEDLVGATFTVKNISEEGIVAISMLKYNDHILTMTQTDKSTGEPVVSDTVCTASIRMLIGELSQDSVTPEEVITPDDDVNTPQEEIPNDDIQTESKKSLFESIIKLLEIIRRVLKSFGIIV